MLISEGLSTPTTPNYPINRMDACGCSEWCCGIPEWPLPLWLKATALNSREQPVTIVLEANSSYMHTEEAPEETPEDVILLHELPLKTWIAWTRWWLLTAKAPPLVLKKKVSGVVGAYLRKETHRIDVRIVRLRTDWSERGRELKLLDKIKQAVV